MEFYKLIKKSEDIFRKVNYNSNWLHKNFIIQYNKFISQVVSPMFSNIIQPNINGTLQCIIWSYTLNERLPFKTASLGNNSKLVQKIEEYVNDIKNDLKQFSITSVLVDKNLSKFYFKWEKTSNLNFKIHYSDDDPQLIKLKVPQTGNNGGLESVALELITLLGLKKSDNNDLQKSVQHHMEIMRPFVHEFFEKMYYIPIGGFDKLHGMLVLETDQDLSLDLCVEISSKLSLLLAPFHLGELNALQFKNALQSAIAAIMSRNASHNIGSHVLSRIATKGINGWTEGASLEQITHNYFDMGRWLQNEINFNSRIAQDWFKQTYRNFDNLLKEPFRWSKDVQFLARYIQQRMDFIAQISTDWPEWAESAFLLKDILRWFLSQKHLLNYIGASEGLKAHFYNNGSIDREQINDIRLHVFKITEMVWSGNDKAASLEERIAQIKADCKEASNPIDPSVLGCKKLQRTQTCDDCHRILLYSSDDGVAQVNLKEDIQFAIPGGIVGYHAFYTIIENVIRNAAKHSYTEDKKHLDIMIEILHDPNDLIGITFEREGGNFTGIPAWLIRIYDNVSQTSENQSNEKIPLWSDDEFGINDRLGKPLIDETGKLRKADWGLAEMKISTGFLQRRNILHIGGEKEKIIGKRTENFLNLGKTITGSQAIIRAVVSPLGTLGYEFYVPKPREIGIFCK